jgi:hypothetical protein
MLFFSSLLLLMQLAVPTAASVHSISINQLQEPTLNLHTILHKSGGVIRISVNNPTYDNGKISDSLMYNIASFRKEALAAMCTCSAFQKSTPFRTDDPFKQLVESHPNDVQQIDLPDGSIRRTLATATVGFDGDKSHPLQVPSWFEQKCGRDAYDSLENLRDVVAKVVDVFVGKLDSENERDQSYRKTLQSANHLEHFHVYFKEGDNEKTSGSDGNHVETNQHLNSYEAGASRAQRKATTLDYHTDAGFFLSFVPAMNCKSFRVDESSFYIKPEEEPIKFEEDEVVILMGAGAQYWMSSNLNDGAEYNSTFLAASHALRLLPNAHRTWYGKMHLLPSSLTSSAFSAGKSGGHALSSVRYGDVLPTFQLENYKAHVPSTFADGCGINPVDLNLVSSVPLAQPSRRRLQHVGSPANCNNQTSFFCWYQCISIPDPDYALEYLRDGHSLYCLDPSMLSDNSVADAAAPCKNGFTHNSACSGSWQLTDESLPGYEFPNYAAVLEEEKAAAAAAAAALEEEKATQTAVEAEDATAAAASHPAPDTGDQYCYGRTSMYMDGFNWKGTTCLVYLFPSWVLTSSGKFGLACIGSILFGILLEYVLWKRRSVYAMTPGNQRLALSMMVYGLQLTMGYFVMLVVMTYSGPLFVSTVGGMMLGHGIFNAQDSYVKRKSDQHAGRDSQEAGAGTRENGATELASSYQHASTRSSGADEGGDSCCGLKSNASNGTSFGPTEKTKLNVNIADGVTPCCQYTV